MNKKILYGVLILIALAFLVWVFILNIGEEKMNYEVSEKNGKTIYTIEDRTLEESKNETDLVMIIVKEYGAMVAELYPDVAPITVKNFKKLVSQKYYDNLTFHRVINSFMIQTGDPTATGNGGSTETIKGEFKNNGIENNISHKKGVLSMARRGANPDTEETMNSASSQFFIVQADSEYLDGNYAGFGKVLYGLDIIDNIAKVQTDEYDKPLKDVVIETIKYVDYFGDEN